MRATIEKLKLVMHDADAALGQAESAGMEVSDARYEFKNVRAALIRTLTGIHRFSPEYLEELAKPGVALAGETKALAATALQEARNRRLQLLLPLGLIVVTIVLIAVKLRAMERR